MLRASADSVDRKRFIVSSAESGDSAVGGVRPGEADRAGDTGELQQPSLCCHGDAVFLFFFLNAHLRSLFEADLCLLKDGGCVLFD